MERLLIVPAAGRGSRLGVDRPKALVEIDGRPMIDHVIGLCHPHLRRVTVVAHPSFSQRMREHLVARWHALDPHVVEQASPTGMLDAILAAEPIVARFRPDRLWILWCDQVGVLPSTMSRIVEAERVHPEAALIFPTVHRAAPYIHFPRDDAGRLTGVLQRREGDRMPVEGESDMGVFALAAAAFGEYLSRFAAESTPGAATGERNFLPFIPWLAARAEVATVPCTDPREAVGVNTPEELRAMERWLRERGLRT